jgi:hypothetical protein
MSNDNVCLAARQAAEVLNEALADARDILFHGETEALDLLCPPHVQGPEAEEQMAGEIQNLLARRLAGESEREPVRFEAWELAALLERTLGPTDTLH